MEWWVLCCGCAKWMCYSVLLIYYGKRCKSLENQWSVNRMIVVSWKRCIDDWAQLLSLCNIWTQLVRVCLVVQRPSQGTTWKVLLRWCPDINARWVSDWEILVTSDSGAVESWKVAESEAPTRVSVNMNMITLLLMWVFTLVKQKRLSAV